MTQRTITLGFLAVLAASAARAEGPAYPWNGITTLTAADGSTLVWTVKQEGESVQVEAKHAKWSLSHTAGKDGTPVSTVKTAGARTVRIDYRTGGASFVVNDGKPVAITESNLWDGDALDARLAGVAWGKVKKVEFNVIDSDSEKGDVYSLVAEYQGVEKCAAGPCHHVRVALSGWRSPFGPKWHFRYGTGEGAPYLENESDGDKFTVKR